MRDSSVDGEEGGTAGGTGDCGRRVNGAGVRGVERQREGEQLKEVEAEMEALSGPVRGGG